MTLGLKDHEVVERILDECAKDGEFDRAEAEAKIILYLETEAAEGRLGEALIRKMGIALVDRALHARAVKVADGQQVLFDPKALCALGEGRWVEMGVMDTDQNIRHQAVLSSNFERQSTTYLTKIAYYQRWLKEQIRTGKTLGELEGESA